MGNFTKCSMKMPWQIVKWSIINFKLAALIRLSVIMLRCVFCHFKSYLWIINHCGLFWNSFIWLRNRSWWARLIAPLTRLIDIVRSSICLDVKTICSHFGHVNLNKITRLSIIALNLIRAASLKLILDHFTICHGIFIEHFVKLQTIQNS